MHEWACTARCCVGRQLVSSHDAQGPDRQILAQMGISSLWIPFFCRKTQSSKDLRRFRPQAFRSSVDEVIPYGSWIDEDKIGTDPDVMCDEDSPTMCTKVGCERDKSSIMDTSLSEASSPTQKV